MQMPCMENCINKRMSSRKWWREKGNRRFKLTESSGGGVKGRIKEREGEERQKAEPKKDKQMNRN